MTARVLVVEDDPDSLEAICLALKFWGYICDSAPSGAEALRLVSANCPDIIISDLMMPGMNGLELLKAIKSQNETCGGKFILLTGHSNVATAVDAIEAGADDFISKPVDLDRLHSVIQELVPHKE